MKKLVAGDIAGKRHALLQSKKGRLVAERASRADGGRPTQADRAKGKQARVTHRGR